MSTTLDEAREELKLRLAALSRTTKWTDDVRKTAAASVIRWIGELIDAKLAVFREEIARSRAPVGESGVTMQYYYRTDGCPADHTRDSRCICWYDQGTGPFPDVVHGGRGDNKAWRERPTPPAKDTGEEARLPPRIRVGQDAEGFWTCREAVPGSPEYVRADLYADLERRLAEAEREMGHMQGHIAHADAYHKCMEKAERERDEARASLETAESRYRDEHAIVDRVWKALGVTTYEEARGKEISQLVAEWKTRAERAELSLETAERRIVELEGLARYAAAIRRHFKASEDDGYRSRDRQFALDMFLPHRETLDEVDEAVAALTTDAGKEPDNA